MDRPSFHRIILLIGTCSCAHRPPSMTGTVGQSAPTPADPTESCVAAAKSRLGGIPPLKIEGPAFDAASLRWTRRHISSGFQEPSPAPDARNAFASISPTPTVLRIFGHAEASGTNPSARRWLTRAQSLIHPEAVRWVFDGPDGRTETFAILLGTTPGRSYAWSIHPTWKKTLPDRPPTLAQLDASVFSLPTPTPHIRWLIEWDAPAGYIWFEAEAVEFGTSDGPFCLPCGPSGAPAETSLTTPDALF